jgi:hypothetical protein
MEFYDHLVDNGEHLTVLRFDSYKGPYDIVVKNGCPDIYDLDYSLDLIKLGGNIATTANWKDAYRIFLRPMELPHGSRFVGVRLYERLIN